MLAKEKALSNACAPRRMPVSFRFSRRPSAHGVGFEVLHSEQCVEREVWDRLPPKLQRLRRLAAWMGSKKIILHGCSTLARLPAFGKYCNALWFLTRRRKNTWLLPGAPLFAARDAQ
jgi:hypothetical protein